MEVLILVLGVFSSATLIISAISTERKRMLLFGMATGVLCLIQFTLNQSLLPMIIGCIGLVRSSVALGALRFPVLNTWPFLATFLAAHTAAFVLTTNWDSFVFVEALPVLGAYLGTIAVFFKRMALTKMFFMMSGAVWLVYQFSAGFYTQMIGETFTLIANGFALSMILKAEDEGIKEEDFAQIDAHVIDTLTGSIPAIKEALTGSIPVVNIATNTLQMPIVSAAPESGTIPRIATA